MCTLNIPLPILASVLSLPFSVSRLCNIRSRYSRDSSDSSDSGQLLNGRTHARHPNEFSLSAEGLFTFADQIADLSRAI